MDTVLERLREQLAADVPKRRMVEGLAKLALTRGPLPDDATRVRVWSALLGVPPGLDVAAEEAAVAATVLDLPNQRVVKVDAERTRPDVHEFRGMVERLTRLLTHYCKGGYACVPAGDGEGGGSGGVSNAPLRPVKYKQGLNELLAPFLMLGLPSADAATPDGVPCDPGLPAAAAPPPAGSGAHPLLPLSDGRVMPLFARMVAKFAPRLYASEDEEFTSLQCSMRLLRLMLQYHDPDLCKYLDQYAVVPELYATPWFLTLFARSLPRPLLMALWDFLVACARAPGPEIVHAIAVAFLMSHRDAILAADTQGTVSAELPMVVSQLTFTSLDHVRSVCASALDILADTPLSFRRLLHNVCYSGMATVLQRRGECGCGRGG
jgi:hypothetical protein